MFEKVLVLNSEEDFNKACELLKENNIEHDGEYAYRAFCKEESKFRVRESGLLDERLQYIFDNVLSKDEQNTAESYFFDDLADKEILDYDYMDSLMRDNVNSVVNEWLGNFEKRVIEIRNLKHDTKSNSVKELVSFINSFENEEFRQELIDIVNYLETSDLNGKERTGYLELRVCDVCRKAMAQGYTIEEGAGYYCSDKCMEEEMTREEFEELYDEGLGDSYFTEWF